MNRVVRPLAVFGIASGLSVAAAVQVVVSPDHDLADLGGSAFFPGYDLAKLEILEPTLYHVEESYVEPARVDWEQMYVAALQAVERRVPTVMFHREPGGEVLALEVGDHRTVLDVPPIGSRKDLQHQLRAVATVLMKHLDRSDIPKVPPGIDDPFAEIEYALVNGMLSTLDPHSLLLPPPDAKEMEVENQGEFGGLGITVIERRGGGLTIESTMPDSPAHGAGLQAEDRILRIDGESTVNMSLDEAVSLLRGPVGAPVDVLVERADQPEALEIRVVRQLIGLNRVEGELLDGGIGYVVIKAFHDNVERDLQDILSRLHREASPSGDLKGLVLDLRGNPGGFLNQAVRVSDTFLTEGDIVSTVDGTGRQVELEKARRTAEPEYPIVVLLDASSASASEIVAGALRNNERAVIVGERSFGKGSVQNLHSFYDDSKLKLTISKYLTPGEKSIQSVGIPADIELRPAIVEADAQGQPVLRLLHRERVRREADLDHSLEQVSFQPEPPAYTIAYVDGPERRKATRPPDDPQVQIARDVLLAAGSRWRRTDVLEAAARVVQQRSREGQKALEAAFAEVGFDWSDGPAAPRGGALPVEVRLDLGEDGQLVAGAEELVGVEITNTGSAPLHRVVAVAHDHGILDGAEFVFGKLEPGETRRFERKVSLVAGQPAERAPVRLDLRDAGEGSLGVVEEELVVTGRQLPRFAWSWTVRDGDGDGVVQQGEKLTIDLTLENVGEGSALATTARIRTDQRKVVDILDGTLRPGTVHEDCVPREVEGSPPDDSDCARIFAPGQTFVGSFEMQLKGEWSGVIDLDLEIREEDAYDYGTIMRAAFYEYYMHEDRIRLIVGGPVPEAAPRVTPVIEVSRAPDLRTGQRRTALSGVVTDDGGLRHVMVFQSEGPSARGQGRGDKVFQFADTPSADATPIRSVPFTADVELLPGENIVTVLATDLQGFTSSRSVVTWLDDEAALAARGD